MSEKIPLRIYKIAAKHLVHNSWEDVILEIIRYQVSNDRNFREQSIRPNLEIDENLEVKLYLANIKSSPHWKEFMTSILVESANKGELFQTLNYAFLFFFRHKKNNDVFVISGGYGSFAIQNRIDKFFGIDVLSRIIDKSNDNIREVLQRGLIGSVLYNYKLYRNNNFKLSYEDDFGKIYQEIEASIGKDVLKNKLGFVPKKDSEKSSVNAGACFILRRNVDIKELSTIIKNISKILQSEGKKINNIERLNLFDEDDKILIRKLKQKLIKNLYNAYSQKSVDNDLFEIVYHDHKRFLEADYYLVEHKMGVKSVFSQRIEKFDTLDDFFFTFPEIHFLPYTENDFEIGISNLKINSYSTSESTHLTTDDLFSHLQTEVEFDGKTYFHIDGEWFFIHPEFKESIKKNLKNISDEINSYNCDFLNEKWNTSKMTEGEYNRKYFGKTNFQVLDTAFLNNMEMCDLIHNDDTKVYFIHVKEGFDRNIRTLCSQIYLSALRYVDAKEEIDNRSFSAYHGDYLNVFRDNNVATKKTLNPLTKTEFIAKLKLTPVFVFAFADNMNRKSFESYFNSKRSSIAKVSLINLWKDLRNLNVEFRIANIHKD